MKLERIQVHRNGHYLETESGKPFFWLADTAWELFHRLTLEEAERYLETRQAQGYNVIKAVVLAECNGLNTPSAMGHLPLKEMDPSRPNEAYFEDVDKVIHSAACKGMYIGLLPTWGDKVYDGLWGEGPIVFTVENARIYGEFLGERYKDQSNVLWILGGDRPAEGYEELWRAMAEGIEKGSGRKDFMTYHPMGGQSSSTVLHAESWLDMNMQQSGHCHTDADSWKQISTDWQLKPAKPTLDGEPCYEDHPIDPFTRTWNPEIGRYTDVDVRKAAYRAVFAGGCGHSYGHHSVWQFWTEDREPINFPTPAWQEALHRPGAKQMIHLKKLMLSLPFFSRVPAPEMLPEVEETEEMSLECRVNPAREAYPVATRCAEGRYALVYFPLPGQKLTIDLSGFSGNLEASWFDPRTGETNSAGIFEAKITENTSPKTGSDWVQVLKRTDPVSAS